MSGKKKHETRIEISQIENYFREIWCIIQHAIDNNFSCHVNKVKKEKI